MSSTRPARAGETLILTATGLGPTRPGLAPGTRFPESPLQEVNSPVEVMVNGKTADVVNGFGWPGTTDTYRLDIRVPDVTSPGMATLQVSAAFIPGRWYAHKTSVSFEDILRTLRHATWQEKIFGDPALDEHTRKLLQPFVDWAKTVT